MSASARKGRRAHPSADQGLLPQCDQFLMPNFRALRSTAAERAEATRAPGGVTPTYWNNHAGDGVRLQDTNKVTKSEKD